jgi:hypothetical protein
MAARAAHKGKSAVVTIKKPSQLQAKHDTLVRAVQEYVRDVRFNAPEAFDITLPAKTDDKDTMIRVSSLMSSVLTATGLGMTARIVAKPAADGGLLRIQFYKPVVLPAAIAEITY